jgi:hypothetical protein
MDSNQSYLMSLIRDYEITMEDSWRNDFSDDPQRDDDYRRERLIEEISSLLNITLEEAESIFEQKRSHFWLASFPKSDILPL